MSTLSRFTARTVALDPRWNAVRARYVTALIERVGGIVTPDGDAAEFCLTDNEDAVTRDPRAVLVTTVEEIANGWHRARLVRGLCAPPSHRALLRGMALRMFGALRGEAFIVTALREGQGKQTTGQGVPPTHAVVGAGLTSLPEALRQLRDRPEVLVLSEAELLEVIEIDCTPLALDDVQVNYLSAMAFARTPPPTFALTF
jgi:hypothetical protein